MKAVLTTNGWRQTDWSTYLPEASRLGMCLLNAEAADANVAAELQQAGVTWARINAYWAYIETRQGVYNASEWNNLIKAVDTLVAHNIRPIVIIQTMPTWLTGATGTRPEVMVGTMTQAKADAYAAFCKKVAQQFGNRVGAYELWNEANLSLFWAPIPSVSDYIWLATAGANAIKAVDSSLVVISMGMGGADVSHPIDMAVEKWAPAFFAQNGHAAFDGIGVHSYNRVPGMLYSVQQVQSYMTAAGAMLPLWVTETGASAENSGTVANTVTEAVQAQIVAQTLTTLTSIAPQGGMVCFYQYKDIDPATNADATEQHFGVMHRFDGSDKPALVAVRAVGAAEQFSHVTIKVA